MIIYKYSPPWNLQFAPENGWLEYDELSFGMACFQSDLLNSKGRVVLTNCKTSTCSLAFKTPRGVLLEKRSLAIKTYQMISWNSKSYFKEELLDS